ncbi:MAG TPA: hypothetical protein VGH33_00210 [Isosphaeraceae bacterium]
MKSMRQARRAFAVERLEDRVVLSQGTFGYLQGFVNSSPAAVLSIPGTYDTSAAQTVVKYTTLSGKSFQVGALSITPTGLTAVVPPYLNPATLRQAAIGVHVTVIQTSAAGVTTTTPAIYHLQITPQPLRTANAGLAAEVTLVTINANLLAAEQSYAQILATVPTATAAYTLAIQADTIRQEALYLLTLIDPVVTGQVKVQPLGSIQGLPLTLDRTGLALLDQTITQTGKAPTTPINIRPDVVSYTTNLSQHQVQDATSNLAKIQPSQAAGAMALGGYAGYGSAIAQLYLYASYQQQVASSFASLVADPTTETADFEAINGALQSMLTSHTVALQGEQLFVFSHSVFALPIQDVSQSEANAVNDLNDLAAQVVLPVA